MTNIRYHAPGLFRCRHSHIVTRGPRRFVDEVRCCKWRWHRGDHLHLRHVAGGIAVPSSWRRVGLLERFMYDGHPIPEIKR